MITEEKIAAIKKELRSGVPEGEIKNMLVQEGYSKEDIDKAFVPHKYDMRGWYLTFAIIFSAISLYQLIVNGRLVFCYFAAGLFYAYYWETQRKLKEKSNG